MKWLFLLPLLTLQETPATSRLEEVLRGISLDHLKANVEKLVSFKTRHTFSRPDHETEGIGAAARWLHSRFDNIARRAKGKATAEFHEFSIREKTARNVYLRIDGKTNPRRAVVFGAHYDSINGRERDPNGPAPGANDDASGCGAVLELARLFSQHDLEWTAIFVTFAGEEQGLLGSRAFARWLKASDLDVVTMVNNDIIGNSRGGDGETDAASCRVFSAPGLDSVHRQLARYVKFLAERYLKGFEVKLQARADRPGRGGDHQSFSRVGIPAVRLIEANENLKHQHSPTDTVDHMDFEYMKKIVEVDAVVLASLFWGPPAPPPPSIENGRVRGKGIVWIRREDENELFKSVDTTRTGQADLSDLEPGFRYRISLCAATDGGAVGPPSEEVAFQPAEAESPR
ncbi:MAG: M28 family peptidase [Planctomycetes bacterium]|nr:M28 family peptidase [Planctomycetota bacterium]